MDVDLEEVRKSGKDLTTMVYFTTGESVDVKSGEAVTAGLDLKYGLGRREPAGQSFPDVSCYKWKRMRKQKSRHIRKTGRCTQGYKIIPAVHLSVFEKS